MALSESVTLDDLRYLARNIEDNLQPPKEDYALVQRVFASAQTIVEWMNVIPPNPDQKRTGGVLVVSREGDVPFVVANQVGIVNIQNPDAKKELDRDKINKYAVYALGKAAVIIQNKGFLSSRENGNLPQDKQLNAEGGIIPGGAIRIGDKEISFSGYSVEDDESVVLATCVLAGEITREESLKIALQLGNSRYSEIIDQLLVREI